MPLGVLSDLLKINSGSMTIQNCSTRDGPGQNVEKHCETFKGPEVSRAQNFSFLLLIEIGDNLHKLNKKLIKN